MGKMALIFVLGLILSVGIIGYTLKKSKTGTVENVWGFEEYSNARNISHTAINIALRALDRNDTNFINNQRLPSAGKLDLMGGSTVVRFSYPGYPNLDSIDLVDTAWYMDSVKVMKLRLKRSPVPFPSINAAVNIRIPNVNFLISSASVLIDGRDHDMSGVVLSGPNDKPGVCVYLPSDTTKVNSQEAAWPGEQIVGTKDCSVDANMESPTSYINDYKAAADFKYIGPTMIMGSTWGSATSPVIIYCDGLAGEVVIAGTVKGWGILVVKGNLRVIGNFAFYGLVITENDVSLIEDVVFGTGAPRIYGSLISTGPSSCHLSIYGNNTLAYSNQALQMAMYINKLQVYRVIRWYE